MKEELLTIKQAVKEVLEESKGAGNNDILCWILVNKKFGQKVWVEDLRNVISPESVRRSRQYWQNQKGICPPTEDVSIMRNKRELEFKEVFR